MAIFKFKNADGNWESVETPGAVKYTVQDLTEDQKAQARENIGVYIQDTEPANIVDGDIWIDTANDLSIVQSINGQTGAVTITASSIGAQPAGAYVLQGDLGELAFQNAEADPTVPTWAKAASKPSYNKSEVGLGNVDNVKQYSNSNPPPYPVTSVNGKTGAVTISALPAVTTADNGKVLMVVNGAWQVVDLNMSIDTNGVVSV